MPDLLIRRVAKKTLEAIARVAARHSRTVEEEIRLRLELHALLEDARSRASSQAMADEPEASQ